LETIQEWSDIMKKPGRWNYKILVVKAMLGLVLTVMVGSANVAPAQANDRNDRYEKQYDGRYDHRGRGYDRDRRVYRSYGYRERDGYYNNRREWVYPPPPVVFAPPPPPGISIFFPPLFIR
jgi:hypothetical protein